jgi:protein required for attachment to host cells
MFIILSVLTREIIMEKTSWIVVADSSRARVFGVLTQPTIKHDHIENDLKLIQELGEHDSHKKTHDVISEKASSNDFGTFVKGSNPKDASHAQFAQNLSMYLEKGRLEHKYAMIILVAPPHFMGLLKQHLSKEVAKLVTQSIEKDYTAENEKALSTHLKIHIENA